MSEAAVQAAQPSLLLSDLFVPAAAGAPMPCATQALPPGLHEEAARLCRSHGWQDDTPWCAAWALLHREWLPGTVCALRLPVARQVVLKVEPGLEVRAWLQDVDAALRADTDTPDADPAVPLWLGCGAVEPGNVQDEPLAALGVRTIGPAALVFRASAALADAAQAQQVALAWAEAAAALVAGAGLRVGQIGVTATANLAQRRSTQHGHRAARPQAPHDTVHGAFALQAARWPLATALVDGSQRLSHAELGSRSGQLALLLQAAGAKPGGLVGVALERSALSVIFLLAILKTGAGYLPLDRHQPPARLAAMLEEAGVGLVIASPEDGALLPSGVVRFPAESIVFEPCQTTPGHPGADVGPAALAYVMYTSGSTGEPKGIEIPHDAVLRLVLDARYADLSPTTVLLHAAPLGFDASTFEIWGALLNGGCCVLHDEAVPTAAGLGRSIRDAGVTTAWLTAALFNAVVDDDVMQLRGLRQLLIGGEALSVAHVRRAQQALPELQLINGYGPTECTTFASTCAIASPLPEAARSVPIGRPITDTSLHVLSPGLQPMPDGLVGELYVGGRGLARGYLKRPGLTAERFIADPVGRPGERLYKTGDRVRVLPDGQLDFIGRADGQIKLRGLRIELGEIEAVLARHPQVQAAAVLHDAPRERLVAYVVPRAGVQPPDRAALRSFAAGLLPGYMVPAATVVLPALPVTPNGKLDRRALPLPDKRRPDVGQTFQPPVSDAERRICGAWAAVLDLDMVGRHDNFFDLGGNSLLVLRVLAALAASGLPRLSPTAFFADPTPAALAAAMRGETAARAVPAPRETAAVVVAGAEPIAIIAMAGRFPGAADVEAFWDQLCAGREGVRFFADAELDPALPAAAVRDAQYVKARGVLDDVALFDAAFFGITAREAELMDPQQRVFLELCWQCLERAGHAPDCIADPVGVFAGMHNATYFQRHLAQRPDLVDKLGDFLVMLGNEKDYLATRVAHRLNLTGPALSLNTACSTSLVAVAQAVLSLRAGQCRMALAGGVAIHCPPASGHLYQQGAMLSPDGHTRSFDADAQGTVFSDGAGVVLLKRLSDALADGNEILALVRGVAVNNDGRRKASFTAPSVTGQAAVIAAAQRDAGVSPRAIGYVEAHGTATPLGDPVEVESLNRAFRLGTDDVGFCKIGSLKSNVGHLVVAAGVAGVIKTALSLANEQLPPTLHFRRPNPDIPFDGSPFTVNGALCPWPRGALPRLAGVSSFGVGGTNAHVVLEEAPHRPAPPATAGPQVLLLSARTPAALERMALDLAAHLQGQAAPTLADAAHTLRVGRSRFAQRLCVVADGPAAAAQALRDPAHARRSAAALAGAEPPLVWLFPGQGAQYPRMGAGLASHDAAFKRAFDQALAAVQPHLGCDLAARLHDDGDAALRPTEINQPATFCLELALGKAWLERGVRPAALIGHSIGEFAAAVLAGVMSLADAATLVARRATLMQAQPPGAMLAVRMAAADLQASLPAALCVAADNGPSACVVAGPCDAVAAWQQVLAAEGVTTRLLPTSHAFHSPLMEGAVAPFHAELRSVQLSPPRIPIVCTRTGEWLTDAQACDSAHWARQLREPVLFGPALRCALERFDAAFLEVGPRGALSTLACRQRLADGRAPVAVPSLGEAAATEAMQWELAAGRLWLLGIETAAPADAPARRRVRLPTYSFDRQRFWVEATLPAAVSAPPPTAALETEMTAVPTAAAAPATASSTPAPAPRHATLVARLRALFEDVSGADLQAADAATPFVELGLDSLTLTQAALQVKKSFAVAITFRQLMESQRSLDLLASHLDNALPADSPPTASAAQPQALPAFASPMLPLAATGSPALQQLIAQQMQLMAQQLALLSGAPVPTAAAAAPAQPATAPLIAAAAAPTDAPAAVRYDVKKAFGAIARIHTQGGEITPRQRARLDAFIRRYVERTRASREYTVAHRPHLADPRVVNGFRPLTKEITYQIVIERSKGAQLWDLDGNQYVDVLNGFGMNLFGWQADFVQDAVRKQLDAGYEIGPQHALAGEVARLVCELTGFDRVGLCNTGSEAVMAALRIARTVTGRSRIVLFTGSYHGTFDEVLVRAGRGGRGIPAAPGIQSGVFGDVQVLDYGTPQALDYLRTHAGELAAVLVEPVQSRRPDFQPRDFLHEVRAITAGADTCLIFDEVITGFRAHPGGAQALFGVRADLACYGKVIGGGFPVGVVAGRRDYMDALDGGAWDYGDDSVPTVGVTYFAGTFVRHPLALAAAKASLEHLREHSPGLQTQLNLHTAAMADELSAFCREAGAPLTIKYFASLWRVSWLEDHPLQDLLFAMMRSRGVHILDNFPCFMTTAHTSADIAAIKTAFKESVAELQEAEFLPRRSEAVVLADASQPPLANARLGRDKEGRPAWFVPDPRAPGRFMKAAL